MTDSYAKTIAKRIAECERERAERERVTMRFIFWPVSAGIDNPLVDGLHVRAFTGERVSCYDKAESYAVGMRCYYDHVYD